MNSRARAIRSRYIVAVVVVLWVLAFVLPNQTLDGFLLLASFPLIVWLLWRLVLAAARRLRGSAARSQTWPYALETGTRSVALADFEADEVPGATTFYASRVHLWAEVIALVFLTLVFGILDVRVLEALASGDFSTALVWFFLPLSLVLAIWAWPRARSALRNVFNRLPVLLLDRDGVECVWGRVGWRDVHSVGLVPHEKERTEVVFTLFPGTAWQPVAARYSDFTLKGRNVGQLRISCLKPKAVLEAVAALREPLVNESTDLERTPNTAMGERSRHTGTSWGSRVALVLGITATVVAVFLVVRATTSNDHPQIATVPPQRPAGQVGGGRTPEEAVRLVDRDLSQKQFGLMWATLDPSVRHSVAQPAFVDCWASWLARTHGGANVQSIKFVAVENAVAPHDLVGIQTKSLTWQEKGIEGDGHSYDTKYTRDIVLANGRWYYVLPSGLRDPLQKGSCPYGGRLVIQRAGPPKLATVPPKPGEIVLVGRATPRIYGPYSFPPGGFVVRFQEFDPARPKVEPSVDGSRFMVALLARDRVPGGTPSRLILNTTAPQGATKAAARAKRYVYVSYSGKYAYVLRFTPKGPGAAG